MGITRRKLTQLGLLGFGGISALSFAGLDASVAKSKLKILVLGGTGFLGPHIVNQLTMRGHTVTLFNRGKTDPHLFPNLEKLKGGRGGKLEPLQGREWDAVIDTSSFIPSHVRKSCKVLQKSVDRYVYISSTAAYKDWTNPNMSEESPVFRLDDSGAEKYGPFERYGASKVACEDVVSELFPNNGTSIRSDTIAGPGDYKAHRYLYWVERALRGGEILAPGLPGHHVQFVDVRDLARWAVHCAENSVPGVYNASSPASSYTMGKMIEDCRQAAQTPSSVVWATSSFLAAQKVADIPFWSPYRDVLLGNGRLSVAKAQENGFTHTPFKQTAADVLSWYQALPEEQQKLNASVDESLEKSLIEKWKAQKAAGKTS